MKKLQYTTNDPASSTDYLAGDNTWKTIPGGGGGSGIPKGTTSGTDTYTTTISGVTAYNDGDAYLIRFSIGNTTGATLNINSLGAKDLYRNNDGLLVGGDIVDGAEMFCIYNSTMNGFQVIGTAPNTLLAYVTNADSVTITKGQPVYAFGGTGDRLTVKLAYNSTDATSAQTVGLVLSTSIAANQKGLIIVNGQLDGLNLFPTATWADGDAVYLGATAGTVTKTKPSAPNHLVYLGFVTTASNGSAGRMYVRVQNGYELNEIHDVAISSPTNGQTLTYNSTTSLWQNTTPISKTFLIGNHGGGTVAIGGTSYGGFVKNGLVIASQAFQVRTVMPEACTLRNWSVYIGAQPATGSLVFTMRLNIVDTAYTLTIAAGSATGVYQNTSGSLSVPAQGILEYKITNNATSISGTIVAVSVTAEI